MKPIRWLGDSLNVVRALPPEARLPEHEAQNLLLRADLMIAIGRYVRKSGLSQTEAAKKLGITQPRLSDLFRHRIERFSLDALVLLAAKTGLSVRMSVKKAA